MLWRSTIDYKALFIVDCMALLSIPEIFRALENNEGIVLILRKPKTLNPIPTLFPYSTLNLGGLLLSREGYMLILPISNYILA
jgi:hypothetical protein